MNSLYKELTDFFLQSFYLTFLCQELYMHEGKFGSIYWLLCFRLSVPEDLLDQLAGLEVPVLLG